MENTRHCLACGAAAPASSQSCARCGEALLVDGRYALTRLLGAGHGHETWAARGADGGACVLTAWRPGPRDDAEAARRERLFAALAGLDHPALPRALEQLRVASGSAVRLVRAWAHVEGEDLRARTARGAPLDEAAARALLAAVLDALAHLHAHAPPLVHRALRPSQIVLGPDGAAALVGLDLASTVGDPGDALPSVAGYVAPEQAAGHPAPASDLYAAGMCVVAALARRAPHALPWRAGRAAFESLVPASPAFAAVLWRLTDPVAERRYGSAREARDAVDALRGAGEVVPARRPARRLQRGYDGDDVGSGRRLTVAEMEARAWRRDDRLVWPASATASSTYGSGWDPSVVAGPPRVFPRHGDIQGAWAPRASSGGVQWLEARFPDDAPEAVALWVFETFHPGAVFAVTDADGGELLWQREPLDAGTEPAVLEVDLGAPRRLRAVRLWLDTSVGASWNEVDTVALVAARPLGRGPVSWQGPTETANVGPPPEGAQGEPARRYDGRDEGAGRRLTVAEMETRAWRGDRRLAWPEGATASSTYGSGWDPSVVAGPPRVFPRHGDIQGAWAPRSPRSGVQWLEVRFPAGGALASGVLVFETNEPGAVFAITDASAQSGGALLWQRAPAQLPQAAHVLEVDLGEPRWIEAVRLWIDTDPFRGWPEIDTVALVVVARHLA